MADGLREVDRLIDYLKAHPEVTDVLSYQRVSGLGRTVRGPSMSANPGKVHVLGVCEVRGEKVIQMRLLQGRNPDWIHRPFFCTL
jgi:hypothetical protein